MQNRITALTLENFKAINTPIKIDLEPITLFFGQNSIGKSTIIQALHYLRGIFENGNLDPDKSLWAGETLDLGGFESIVNGHDLSKTIKIRVDFRFYFDELKMYPAFPKIDIGDFSTVSIKDIKADIGIFNDNGYIEIEVAFDDEFKKVYIKKFVSGFLGNKVAEIVYDPAYTLSSGGKYFSPTGYLQYVNFDHEVFCGGYDYVPGESFLRDVVRDVLPDDFIVGENDTGLSIDNASPFPIYSRDSLSLSADEDYFEENGICDGSDRLLRLLDFESYMTQLTKGPCEILLSILKDMVYVGPLRKIPERNFSPNKTKDPARWSNGLAAWDEIYQADQDYIDKLNSWLVEKERLNTGYKFEQRCYRELNSDSEIWNLLGAGDSFDNNVSAIDVLRSIPEKSELLIRDLRQNCTVHLHDIGIGISQVMPILACALAGNVSIAAIEQPELHIHPGMQCRLADLLILAAGIENKEHEGEKYHFSRKIFILETHSEHLLLRLLRRIRETSEQSLPEWHTGLRPENVSVNFIDFVDGKYKHRRLGISDDGDSLGEWPEGFFEERAGELF